MTTANPVSDDLHRLQSILDYISDILRWTVQESELLPPEVREEFLAALGEIVDILASVRNELDGVDERDERWALLRRVGLTARQLVAKAASLRHLVSRKAGVGKVMEWINSILGSLAKVFPVLDAVQEYKEHVELVVKHQHGDGPAPLPQPMFDLR